MIYLQIYYLQAGDYFRFISVPSRLQGENLVVAVDDDGCFTSRITDFSGRYVKDADKDIVEAVKVSCINNPLKYKYE